MEQSQQQVKGIPYGMQNWEEVRLSNYYYVDKSRFIPKIEAANRFFFFNRPRRFGKSLLMHMLRKYYDVNRADRFDRLFGDLWIGANPTPLRNSYLVLFLDFSAFAGDLEGYKARLDDYCDLQFESFIDYYKDLLPDNALAILRSATGAANKLAAISTLCFKAGRKIYLFIDEYDHFTNAILSDPSTEPDYKAQTHGTGAFRAFFNAIKSGTDSAIDRLFVTGVSPVTMDDLTSGFNIGTNYTAWPQFNDMVGFTESDVRQMLDYYRRHYTFRHTTDELIDIMRPWYDNYCFSKDCLDQPTMYNSDMVLYFLNWYINNGGTMPHTMLDNNIRTDYNKLRMLIRKDHGFDNDASIVQTIIETGGITAELKSSFPSETITSPDNFVSLLYYFGLLTIAGSGLRGTKFRIPNQVVREQMYGYIAEAYRQNDLSLDEYHRKTLMTDMASDGEWKPYFDYIADVLHRFASQRDRQKGEAFVHGFTLAQTCMSSLYLPVSELDAGIDGGYADIYLQPMLGIYPDIEHSYLLELKYVRSSATDADVEQARRVAIDQLTRYQQRSEVIGRTVGHTRLHRLVLVWRGMELAVAQEF